MRPRAAHFAKFGFQSVHAKREDDCDPGLLILQSLVFSPSMPQKMIATPAAQFADAGFQFVHATNLRKTTWQHFKAVPTSGFVWGCGVGFGCGANITKTPRRQLVHSTWGHHGK